MKLGFHVSINGGMNRAVDRAVELNCSTFQVFTRNPRSWNFQALTEDDINSYRIKITASGINPVYAHMPYIPNLSSPNNETYQKSKASLIEEIKRCKQVGIPFIITHLGSHLGVGEAIGRERLVTALNEASAEGGPMILLENGAGSINNIGNHFEKLIMIIDEIEPEIGICLDTCHAFAAGYDISSKSGFEYTLKTIESTIGFNRIKLVHLNDSVGNLNSHIDRHEHIGLGKIGIKGFKQILCSQLSEIPLIMVTPIDDRRGDAENMKLIKKLLSVNISR
ncbi:MAG: deoxyribonuclease IV [Candidatus Bathyarchaeota archaeon]|nr:deoxyribonuclease IV [Candidatus Bathyarchaeota archaeon]